MGRVIFLVRDISPAKMIVATIPHLRKAGISCELWCEEHGRSADVAISQELSYKTIHPDEGVGPLFGGPLDHVALAVGFSSPMQLESIAAQQASRRKIPWVGFEDQAGVSSRCYERPDLLLTPDLLGESQAKKIWGRSLRTVIVGSHAVPDKPTIPRDDLVAWAEKEWKEKPVIVFSEFCSPENGAAEEQIAAAIRLMRQLPAPWRLCVRLHPKWEKIPAPGNGGRAFGTYLRQCFSPISERLVPSPVGPTTDEVIALPQVKAVVAGGATSSLTAAVVSGKVALSVVGERTRKMLKADFAGATQAPLVRLGLCTDVEADDPLIAERFLALVPTPISMVRERLRPFEGTIAAAAIRGLSA